MNTLELDYVRYEKKETEWRNAYVSSIFKEDSNESQQVVKADV